MGFYTYPGKKVSLDVSAAAGKSSSMCPASSGAKKQIFCATEAKIFGLDTCSDLCQMSE